MKSPEDLQREIADTHREIATVNNALNASVPQFRRDFADSFRVWSEALVRKYILDNAIIASRGKGASLGGLRVALDQAYRDIQQRYASLLSEDSQEWPHITTQGQAIDKANAAVDTFFVGVFQIMSHHLGEALFKNKWLFYGNVLPAPWRKEGSYIYPGYYENVAGIVNGFAEIRRYKRELQYRASLRATVQRKDEDRYRKLAEAYWLKACQAVGQSEPRS